MRCGFDLLPPRDCRISIAWNSPAKAFLIGRHDRRQMPVGQGGFHVGALSAISSDAMSVFYERGVDRFRDASFLYVYDCGAEPKKHIVREIGHLAKQRTQRKLDVLFLSHFDRDHICGTPNLLSEKKGFQVDTIVLPFVDDVERVIAFARAAAATSAGQGEISRFFLNMIVDPIQTLQGFDPRQIVQVVSGDGGPPIEGSPGDPPSFDDPDGSVSWKLVSGKDERRSPTVLHTNPNDAGVAGRASVFITRDPAIVVRRRDGAFEWLLKPWVRPADPTAVAHFCTAAENELGWARGTFRTRMANRKDRRHVVTRGRTELARAYKTAFLDKNLTSMCLYSGLAAPDEMHSLTIDPSVPWSPSTKIGWMGTGDARLKTHVEIDEFEHFFRAEISYVSSFAFPHHGSIENSNPNRLVSDAEYWVASAEPIHDWPHPHPDLQSAALKKGWLRHVLSLERSAFDEAMIFARAKDVSCSACSVSVSR